MPKKKSAAGAESVSATGRRRKGIPVARRDVQAAAASADRSVRKQRSFYLTEDVFDRMRRVAYWARVAAYEAADAGEPVDVEELPPSVSALVETAIWAEVLRWERQLHEGEPFPPVPGGRLAPGPGASGVRRLRERWHGDDSSS